MQSYWIRQAQHTYASKPDTLKERKSEKERKEKKRKTVNNIVCTYVTTGTTKPDTLKDKERKTTEKRENQRKNEKKRAEKGDKQACTMISDHTDIDQTNHEFDLTNINRERTYYKRAALQVPVKVRVDRSQCLPPCRSGYSMIHHT